MESKSYLIVAMAYRMVWQPVWMANLDECLDWFQLGFEVVLVAFFLVNSPISHTFFYRWFVKFLKFLPSESPKWVILEGNKECHVTIFHRRFRTKEKLNPYLLFILLLFRNLTFIILKLITFSVTLILTDTTKD